MYDFNELTGMRKPDLVLLYADIIGHEPKSSVTKQELIDDILKAQPEDLDNSEEVGKCEPVEQAPLPGIDIDQITDETGGKRTRIIFHNQDGPGGSDDIFVSVNGKAYLIKREHEVALPRDVMEVIENARQTVFERADDNRISERLIKRYSFSILGDVVSGEAA